MMIGGDDLITDDSIIVDGNAKINLTLDILGKRPDGYHDLDMIMQHIDLHDDLYIENLSDNELGLGTFTGTWGAQ